jgi:hypothetical protein
VQHRSARVVTTSSINSGGNAGCETRMRTTAINMTRQMLSMTGGHFHQFLGRFSVKNIPWQRHLGTDMHGDHYTGKHCRSDHNRITTNVPSLPLPLKMSGLWPRITIFDPSYESRINSQFILLVGAERWRDLDCIAWIHSLHTYGQNFGGGGGWISN